MKTLSERIRQEREMESLVNNGPAPTELLYEELLEVVHCLSIENKRLRCRVDQLEAEKKTLCRYAKKEIL